VALVVVLMVRMFFFADLEVFCLLVLVAVVASHYLYAHMLVVTFLSLTFFTCSIITRPHELRIGRDLLQIDPTGLRSCSNSPRPCRTARKLKFEIWIFKKKNDIVQKKLTTICIWAHYHENHLQDHKNTTRTTRTAPRARYQVPGRLMRVLEYSC